MNAQPHTTASDTKSFRLIYGLCSVIVCFFLVLCLLLYNSQEKLQQHRHEQFISNALVVSNAFKGYFAELNRDLRTLASAQAFSSYFHNKSLGISLDYGMSAIISDIRMKLQRFLLEYKIEEEYVFSNASFTDYEGKLRIQVSISDQIDEQLVPLTENLTEPVAPSPALFLRPHNKHKDLTISFPYYFMGKHVGELTAQIAPFAIQRHLQLIQNHQNINTILFYGSTSFASILSNKNLKCDTSDLPSIPPDTPLEMPNICTQDGKTIPMVATLHPVLKNNIASVSFIDVETLQADQFSNTILFILYGVFAIAAISVTLATKALLKNSSLAERLKKATNNEELINKHLAKLQSEIVVRRKAEIHALTAQQKAEQLTHVVPSAVFMVTLERKIESWNKRAEELTGYKAYEVIGTSCDNLFLNTCRNNCMLSYQHHSSCGTQHSLKKKDGEIRTILKNTEPLLDGFGQLVGLIESFEDITDQQKTLAALATAEENYRTIIQNAQDGIYQSALSGEILNANPAFLNIFDFTTLDEMRDSFRSQENHFYVDPARRAEFVNTMLKKRFVTNFESQVCTHSGRTIWVVESARLQTAPDGSIRFEGFVRDISAQKKAEENLIAAKEAAESANIAKNNFLANISHELRTPMNAIIGISELSLHSEQSPEQRRNTEVLYQASTSLLTLLNDLLDFSAIDSNVLSLKYAPFSPQDLLTTIQDLMQCEADKKGLTLAFETSKTIPPLLSGDKERIKQILVNLIWNALKFTKEGTVTVKCSTASLILQRESIDEDSALAPQAVLFTCAITDTGIGIPEDKLTDIFDSFSQVHSSYHSSCMTPHGGVGLGLSISQKLALKMGGSIYVESKLGEGSTFTVQIPCDVLPEAEQAAYSQSQTEIVESCDPVAPLNILVAEDNIFSQEVLTQMLKEDKHTVFVADNGKAVLEMLQYITVDVILMDVQMPILDGLETTRRIRSGKVSHVVPDIPIVTISAHNSMTAENSFIESGVTENLPKPITLHSLRKVLHTLFGDLHPVRKPTSTSSSVLPKNELLHNASHINIESILKMVDGKQHVLETVLNTYLSSLPATLELLTNAFVEKKQKEITRLTHSLKATMGSMGATSLTRLAEDMEHNASIGNIDYAHSLLEQFIFDANESLADVEHYLNNLDAQNTGS